jgi:hypothetical protein
MFDSWAIVLFVAIDSVTHSSQNYVIDLSKLWFVDSDGDQSIRFLIENRFSCCGWDNPNQMTAKECRSQKNIENATLCEDLVLPEIKTLNEWTQLGALVVLGLHGIAFIALFFGKVFYCCCRSSWEMSP